MLHVIHKKKSGINLGIQFIYLFSHYLSDFTRYLHGFTRKLHVWRLLRRRADIRLASNHVRAAVFSIL